MQLTEKLYDLFLLEKQIRGMQSRLDSATRRCSAQQAKHDQLLRQQEEMTDQLKHGRAKANDRESMAAEIEQKIAHQRELMNNVKSNKEYSSLLIEINTYKLDKENAEQEALEQMSAVDLMDQELVEVTDKAKPKRSWSQWDRAKLKHASQRSANNLTGLFPNAVLPKRIFRPMPSPHLKSSQTYTMVTPWPP